MLSGCVLNDHVIHCPMMHWGRAVRTTAFRRVFPGHAQQTHVLVWGGTHPPGEHAVREAFRAVRKDCPPSPGSAWHGLRCRPLLLDAEMALAPGGPGAHWAWREGHQLDDC